MLENLLSAQLKLGQYRARECPPPPVGALDRFYAAARKATPQIWALTERYGGDVSFSFDSNGRSV